jgi:hypothetical protein
MCAARGLNTLKMKYFLNWWFGKQCSMQYCRCELLWQFGSCFEFFLSFRLPSTWFSKEEFVKTFDSSPTVLPVCSPLHISNGTMTTGESAIFCGCSLKHATCVTARVLLHRSVVPTLAPQWTLLAVTGRQATSLTNSGSVISYTVSQCCNKFSHLTPYILNAFLTGISSLSRFSSTTYWGSFDHTHIYRHTVGLLWTSDQPVTALHRTTQRHT